MRHPLHLNLKFFALLSGMIVLFIFGELIHPAMVIVAWIYGGGLLLALIFDTFIAHSSAKKLKVSRKTPQHFSLHDENKVEIHLDYQGERPLVIDIFDETPSQFQLRDLSFTRKLEKGQEVLQYFVTPVIRGAYSFDQIQVLAQGPFGLSQWQKTYQKEVQLVKVFPSFMQMQFFEALVFQSNNAQLGIRKTRRLGHGYEFSHIRQYAQGDDPRTLNIRASARSGKWMVNSFIDERSQAVYALILTGRIMRMPFDGLTLLDYSINSSLSLLNVAMKNQDQAGLITFSGNVKEMVPANSKSQQLQMIMDKLYNVEADYEEANYEGLYQFVFEKIRRRSLLLLFGHFMTISSLERVLPELKKLNFNHLLVVIFFKNTELEGFRDQVPEDLQDIAAQTMAAKLVEDQFKMARILAQHGIQCVHTSPDQLSSDVLSKYLELKSRGLI